jgi:hypothetical protein
LGCCGGWTGGARRISVTFLQEREQYINELADLDSLAEESEADAQVRWNKLRALHREYADEIARR